MASKLFSVNPPDQSRQVSALLSIFITTDSYVNRKPATFLSEPVRAILNQQYGHILIQYLPRLLLYSRPVLILIILTLTFIDYANSNKIVLIIMYIGIISDIFDGILARKLNISTTTFRLHDTIFDLFFYFSILFYINSINQLIIRHNIYLIGSIIGLESILYMISLTRFHKFPSPHAILSKFWGIYLIIEFTLLIIGVPGLHFRICLIIGLFVHIDRVLIYSIIKNWDHDIPSFYHAIKLRNGKTIFRGKIFNG